MVRASWIGLGCWLLVGCGDGGGGIANPDAAAGDGGEGVDAGPSCGTTWVIEERPALELRLMDSSPVNGARSVRVAVTVQLAPCEELATMSVSWAFEVPHGIITPRVWRPVGADCREPGRMAIRPVTLTLGGPQNWTITAPSGAGPAVSLTIPVAVAPARACDPGRAGCEMDCDCASDGERCLGFDGLTGPLLGCGRPCELDRDCGGTACDGTINDGLGFVCSDRPECGAGEPCPEGWTCQDGACDPAFTLGQAIRHECSCDAGCDAGLRCVNPYDPAAPRRCEATCATNGPWCQGAHVCGEVGADLSGLAGADAVCVWLGE